jgi:hypothetical protein
MATRRSSPTVRGPLDERLLRIYLRDHGAAAVGGTELARRALANNRGTPFEVTLEQLTRDVEEDRQTFVGLMDRLGMSPDFLKQSAVWVLEKVARLKLNGRVLEYSPLSRLEELEALGTGIEGKRALWAALRHVAGADPRLNAAELGRLERRAADQRKRVEVIRLEAARLALAPR